MHVVGRLLPGCEAPAWCSGVSCAKLGRSPEHTYCSGAEGPQAASGPGQCQWAVQLYRIDCWTGTQSGHLYGGETYGWATSRPAIQRHTPPRATSEQCDCV